MKNSRPYLAAFVSDPDSIHQEVRVPWRPQAEANRRSAYRIVKTGERKTWELAQHAENGSPLAAPIDLTVGNIGMHSRFSAVIHIFYAVYADCMSRVPRASFGM
jgi:hypothetical protein